MKLIATIFTLLMFMLVGCAPAEDVDPTTGMKLKSELSNISYSPELERIARGVQEFEYKGHWFLLYSGTNYSGASIIHAPYCQCQQN